MRRASASTGRKTRAPRTRSRPRSRPSTVTWRAPSALQPPSRNDASDSRAARARQARGHPRGALARDHAHSSRRPWPQLARLQLAFRQTALASNPTDRHFGRRRRSRSAAGLAGGHPLGLAKTSQTRGRRRRPATPSQSWRRGGLHQPSSLPRSQPASETYSAARTQAKRQVAVAPRCDKPAGRVRAPPSTESHLPSRPADSASARLPNVRAFSCESRAYASGSSAATRS